MHDSRNYARGFGCARVTVWAERSYENVEVVRTIVSRTIDIVIARFALICLFRARPNIWGGFIRRSMLEVEMALPLDTAILCSCRCRGASCDSSAALLFPRLRTGATLNIIWYETFDSVGSYNVPLSTRTPPTSASLKKSWASYDVRTHPVIVPGTPAPS